MIYDNVVGFDEFKPSEQIKQICFNLKMLDNIKLFQNMETVSGVILLTDFYISLSEQTLQKTRDEMNIIEQQHLMEIITDKVTSKIPESERDAVFHTIDLMEKFKIKHSIGKKFIK